MRHLKRQRVAIVLSVVFSKMATDRLIEQALYIYQQTQNFELADNYLDEMKRFILLTLHSFPKAGRPCEELVEGARKLVYKGFSIIYQVGDEQIEILTIYRENLI